MIPQCCIIHCNIACLALFGKFYLFPLQREWGITPSAGVVRVQILHKYKIKRIKSISIYNMWMEHFRIYIETGRLGLVLKVKKNINVFLFFPLAKFFHLLRRKVLSGALLSSLYFSVCLPHNDFGYILAPYDLADRKTFCCTLDVQKMFVIQRSEGALVK